MRREEYVDDVSAELRIRIKKGRRLEAWRTLTAELENTSI